MAVRPLARAAGSIAGQYAESSYVGLIGHLTNEYVHHAAEVRLLRHLHKSGGGAMLGATRPAVSEPPLTASARTRGIRVAWRALDDAVTALRRRSALAVEERLRAVLDHVGRLAAEVLSV